MFFPWNKKRSSDNDNNENVEPLNAKAELIMAIDAMGCERKSSENEADLPFSYQQGEFVASFFDNSPLVRIIMPTALSTEMTNINEVRFVCNLFNSQRYTINTFYISSSDEKNLYMSLSTTITGQKSTEVRETLTNVLKDMFEMRNEVLLRFGDLIKRRGEMHPFDFEVSITNQMRKTVLVRESEILHGLESVGQPLIGADIVLSDFLDCMAGIDASKAIGLDIIVPGEPTTTVDCDNIGSYRLVQDMFPKTSPDTDISGMELLTPSHQWVMLRLRFKGDADSVAPRVVTVDLSDYGRGTKHAYLKAVVTVEGNDPMDSTSPLSPDAEPKVFKTVIRVSTDKGHADESEYRYMMTDARDKLASGHENELTPEQELLTRAFVSSTGYYLYHGSQHFASSRYAQALMMLLNVYNDMAPRYHKMDDAAKSAFRDICFMIGFCYCEFRRYDRAYYYLTQTINNGEFNHDQEYINCMVNAGDPRATEIVENALRDISQFREQNDDAVTQQTEEMYNFLRRRQVYLYIEQRRLTEASELLQPMVEEDINRSFAIDELAYISRLRGDDSGMSKQIGTKI